MVVKNVTFSTVNKVIEFEPLEKESDEELWQTDEEHKAAQQAIKIIDLVKKTILKAISQGDICLKYSSCSLSKSYRYGIDLALEDLEETFTPSVQKELRELDIVKLIPATGDMKQFQKNVQMAAELICEKHPVVVLPRLTLYGIVADLKQRSCNFLIATVDNLFFKNS